MMEPELPERRRRKRCPPAIRVTMSTYGPAVLNQNGGTYVGGATSSSESSSRGRRIATTEEEFSALTVEADAIEGSHLLGQAALLAFAAFCAQLNYHASNYFAEQMSRFP